ncbi:MAG: PAS domain S-box protein [Bacteroidota bacterium]|nr:PAS domain S-box protein [Bacteroidota bacterium]
MKKYLPHIQRLLEAEALAVYQVRETDTVLLCGSGFSDSALTRIAKNIAADSQLQRIVARQTTSVVPAEKINGMPARFSSCSVMRVPVLMRLFSPRFPHAGQRTVGVFEIVAPASRMKGKEFDLLSFAFVNQFRALLKIEQCQETSAKEIETYHSLIENLSDGLAVVRDLKFVYVNSAFATMHGYADSRDLTDKSILTVVAKEDQERVAKRSRARAEGKSAPTRYEYKGLRRDGETFDVEVMVNMVHFEGKRSALGIHRDITRRKHFENEIQQSEQMFRTVIDGILTVGDALVVTDLEGKVLQVNSEFEHLTGLKRSEATGQIFPYQWLLEEDMSRYLLWISELRKKKYLLDFDIHWKNKEGKIIAVSMNTTLLFNALGHPVAMMNMARDISSRKQLEEENKMQLERLRVLYEVSRDLTAKLNPEEICETLLQHLREVLLFDAFSIDRYSEESHMLTSVASYQIVDTEFQRIQPPSLRQQVEKHSIIAKAFEQRKSVIEEVQDNKDALRAGISGPAMHGEMDRTFSLIYVPMLSKQKIIGMLAIRSSAPSLYNETHMRLLESFANLGAIALEKAELYDETIKKSVQIQNRNRELDDFTYVVSHDLKEPLITVEGYSKILLSEFFQGRNDQAATYVQSIVQSCGRMKELINELLQLSRVSHLAEVMELVPLGTIVAEVLEDLKFSIQEKKVTILQPEHYPEYRCNPTQMQLVFRNLLSNAMKFNDKPNPTVTITVEEEEQRLLCSIADNGLGIERKFFDKIFVIFQRLHLKDDYEGAGAGLAIVKKIIELRQGQIWLDSEVGKGTTFYFSLPK